MLGGGLEPPCLAAYAPQTYVSAISPPERVWSEELECSTQEAFWQVLLSFVTLEGPGSRDAGSSQSNRH
jgi:hypothetical protein